MVVVEPQADRRRRFWEGAIRIIDMAVYLFAVAGGILALLVPPTSIRVQLQGYEWIGVFWGTLLLVAGVLGFIGRFTRIWLIEAPGTVGAIAGGLIYAFVLAITASTATTAWVAFCIVAMATLDLYRRYVELQIFTNDPTIKTMGDRIRAVLRRRTTNSVGQHR